MSESKLKQGVAGDLRSLAVEIVDAMRGHTIDYSNQPGVHQHDYDIVERYPIYGVIIVGAAVLVFT